MIPHWPTAKAQEFKDTFGIKHVKILNDFEAIGYGVQTIRDEEMVALQENEKDPDGIIGVMGAGTGLGEAFCIPEEGSEIKTVIPTEGGFTEFKVWDDEDMEIVAWLKEN